MTETSEEQGWATAKTLAEALPYIQRYDRETVVIKYGGHAMGEEAVAKLFAADAVLLKLLGLHPVVVHGGGPQISRMLERSGVKSTFIDGLRVTDAATMEIAEMVLSGAINKEIASWITQAGREADVRGVGLSGKDGGLVTVTKARRTQRDPDSNVEQVIDLGFVGEPQRVDPQLIEALIYAEQDYIPVIAPIGVSAKGETFNINADTMAGALAGALRAKRMLMLTDVAGVLDKNGELIREMTVKEAFAAIKDGTASGGMIPKLETAIAAVDGGVEAVVIIDGRRPHAILTELFTAHGAGTMIPRVSADLHDIDTWLFDLDGALYPLECGFLAQMEGKMTAEVARLLGLDLAAAYAVQKKYLAEHGTTLSGLMIHHAVEPQAFMDAVHDVPLDCIPQDLDLRRGLQRLPGRRLVFTNADERHAHRVLAHLQIDDLFEDVFHIASGDYVPKPRPEAFAAMMARHAVDPATTCFFEDSARNLEPAAALGMTTVLVGPNALESRAAFVHHRTISLPAFLLAAQVQES